MIKTVEFPFIICAVNEHLKLCCDGTNRDNNNENSDESWEI